MTSISAKTAGVFCVAPTPFGDDGQVDIDSLDNLVDFYHSIGVSGITILGQMGEAPKLTATEGILVARRVISRSRVPVVVGITSPGMASMRSLSDQVMDAGAAGVLIAPPNTLRSDETIVDYYRLAVQTIGADVPFVLQDYPLTFSVVMSLAVIKDIVNGHPSCVMLKHEDWPGLEKISALRRAEAQGTMRALSILCGNGGLFLDFEMERGADGAMTGYCFPEMLIDVVSGSSDRERAHAAFDLHLPLLRYEQQPRVGLAVRKYVLARRGIISTPTLRGPATLLSADGKAEIDFLLERLGRFDDRCVLAS